MNEDKLRTLLTIAVQKGISMGAAYGEMKAKAPHFDMSNTIDEEAVDWVVNNIVEVNK